MQVGINTILENAGLLLMAFVAGPDRVLVQNFEAGEAGYGNSATSR